jgi:ABC-type Fe3+ transport system permease subunit
MKLLTLLEVGNLNDLVIMIIAIIFVVVFVISLFVAAITKAIYEWNNEKKFSKGQFWMTVLISMLVGGLISGFVCGGM